jgi:hypothetical protein
MKRMACIVSMMTLACVLSGWTHSVAAGAAEEQAALVAAKEWLALVDAGKYGESWDACATFMRNAVTKEHWIATMNIGRKPLGKLLSRSEKSKTFATTLPGAPDGQYVVIQFDTSFENKRSSVETVTPMKDKDGKWRVSGYYMK